MNTFRALVLLVLSTALAHAQSSSSDLQDLLARYRQARADTSTFLSTRSIVVNGTVEQGDREFEFELAQRESGQIRYELKSNGRNLIQVFDGRDGWLWTAGRPEAGVRKMTDAQVRFFEMTSGFYSPLDIPQTYDLEPMYLGVEMNDDTGEPEYHVRLENERVGERIDIWIDANSFLELRRSYRPSEEAPVLETRFSDYRVVDGFTIPHEVETWFQGKVLSTAKVDKVSRNPGMLSFYFAKPSTYKVVAESE